MDTPIYEADQLQQQMRQLRMNLGEEVHDLVEHARAATDWRLYWRNHPWAWCGAVAALGYLIVPARHFGKSDARSLVELSQLVRLPAPPSASRRIMAELAGMAIGFVAQRGMQVLGHRLENLLSSHPESGNSSAPPGRGLQGKGAPGRAAEGTGTQGKKRRTDHE